ncbi:24327_t:CDS:2 [Cetraspora pellucida]|uniref:24327_t:CDS:1 n=1 Tax=Cetraspora pellucida TaxID=1433469 RepID=A0A9N8Z0G1_9GLOM|nr:24327_t:CDS:2 [Cetraspora pellucida]
MEVSTVPEVGSLEIESRSVDIELAVNKASDAMKPLEIIAMSILTQDSFSN